MTITAAHVASDAPGGRLRCRLRAARISYHRRTVLPGDRWERADGIWHAYVIGFRRTRILLAVAPACPGGPAEWPAFAAGWPEIMAIEPTDPSWRPIL